MPDRPELILHTGVNYTGMAYIWRSLQVATEELRKQGIKVFHPSQLGESWLEVVLGEGTKQIPWADEGIRRLIVFDGSLACNPYAKQLTALPQFYDCKLSLFLLRQDLWLEKRYVNYVTRLRQPMPKLSLKDFLKNHKDFENCLEYGGLLDKWAELFGRDNLKVQPVDHTLDNAAAVKKFARLWDLDSVMPPHTANGQSIGTEWTTTALEIARLLKTGSYPQHQRQLIHSKLKQTWPAQAEIRRLFGTSQAREILENYEQSNRYVARTYCALEQEKLFNETDLEGLTESETISSEPGQFVSEQIEPILSMLVQHLLYMREKAQTKNESIDRREKEKREKLAKLSRKVHALEDLISTPSRTVRQLWRIVKRESDAI